jgi:hypothetical protein
MADSCSTRFRVAGSLPLCVSLKGVCLIPAPAVTIQSNLFASQDISWSYIEAMEKLIAHLCAALKPLADIKPERILVGNTYSKPGRRRHLSYARILAPRLDEKRQPMHPPLMHHGREYDYVITFCLPRFWELSYEDKLTTVIHELYHIAPEADGGLRQMGVRKYAHGSRRGFEAKIKPMVEQILTDPAFDKDCAFLRYNGRELCRIYGSVRIRPLRITRVRSSK